MNGGDGRVDAQMQGTTMLELLSMEIQMHKKLGNLKLVRVRMSTLMTGNV